MKTKSFKLKQNTREDRMRPPIFYGKETPQLLTCSSCLDKKDDLYGDGICITCYSAKYN